MTKFLWVFSWVVGLSRIVSCFHVGRPASFVKTKLLPILKEGYCSGKSSIQIPSYNHALTSGSLFSLRGLIEEISDRPPGKEPTTIFVGGKGGVGKTTCSAALAVRLASSYEDDLKVLVVSTDPAHSLGDALDEDLRKGRGKPIVMTDPLTGGRLHACEIDASAALEEFRKNLEAFDIGRLADALGVSPELLEGFGLGEFSGLLNNPPPGLDELVALSNVLDTESIASEFDVVIVDTAPTGHTLRLLALPQFLDGLLGKLIKLRMKLSGLASTLQALFGDSEADRRAKTLDNAVEKLEAFRTKMARLRSQLQDSSRTSFMVVTIPTKLGISESKRLMKELKSQGVSVTDVVLNQCVADFDGEHLLLGSVLTSGNVS
jgi:arsenite-transporting ATPase